jgi:hypothetical protein
MEIQEKIKNINSLYRKLPYLKNNGIRRIQQIMENITLKDLTYLHQQFQKVHSAADPSHYDKIPAGILLPPINEQDHYRIYFMRAEQMHETEFVEKDEIILYPWFILYREVNNITFVINPLHPHRPSYKEIEEAINFYISRVFMEFVSRYPHLKKQKIHWSVDILDNYSFNDILSGKPLENINELITNIREISRVVSLIGGLIHPYLLSMFHGPFYHPNERDLIMPHLSEKTKESLIGIIDYVSKWTYFSKRSISDLLEIDYGKEK